MVVIVARGGGGRGRVCPGCAHPLDMMMAHGEAVEVALVVGEVAARWRGGLMLLLLLLVLLVGLGVDGDIGKVHLQDVVLTGNHAQAVKGNKKLGNRYSFVPHIWDIQF